MKETAMEHRNGGWTNTETWYYAMCIDNNRYLYQQVQDLAAGYVEELGDDPEACNLRDAAEELGATLEATLKANNPLLPGAVSSPSRELYRDLLDLSIARVNFYEYALATLEEMLDDRAGN